MGGSSCGQRGLGGVPLPGTVASWTNGSTEAVVFPDAVDWDASLVRRVVPLSVIMFFTIAGNAAIVAVLARPRAAKRASRVNLFILHLAIGDLAVGLFTQSSEMLFEISGGWVLGGPACKAVVYVQMVTLASTTFILASMSYDRYAAICRPLESRSGLRRAKAMVAVSWAMAFLLALPQLFIFVQVQTGVTTSGRAHFECLSVGYTRHWQRQLYFSWLTLYILVAPGILISACYLRLLRAVWAASGSDGSSCLVTTSRSSQRSKGSDKANGKSSPPTLRRCAQGHPLLPRARAKTLKLTVCIIASFMLCWIPYFTVHNVRIHSHYCIKVPRAAIVFAETVALLNSAVNPVFYGLFNVHIRRGICDILPCIRGHRRGRRCSARDSTMRQRTGVLTTTSYAPDAGSVNSPALSSRGRSLCHQSGRACGDVTTIPLVAINGSAVMASVV
ncbi:oxytocin receptor-like [Dermacentor andersoni]|uniref:oxytocin receptor-like n=1 Tax=Dermacentor andersoni TaxID=34620 RepID=UPI0021557D5B|nr:oxytocin receptor-like [Dermacentor andersoni]